MIVTLSGIDGSGKTTRCEALVSMLRERGLPAAVGKPAYEANNAVKEFCEWAFGDRFAYFNRLDGEFYISCLTADWMAFLARVLATSGARILICDRYICDLLAQAFHMNASALQLLKLCDYFPQPDISYFLEVSPETAHDRLSTRREPAIHLAESLGELRTLHAAYARAWERLRSNMVTVRQSTPTEELAMEVERKWHKVRI